MSPIKFGVLFLISLAFTGVATWTIDLPEARVRAFGLAGAHKDDQIKKDLKEKDLFFDNIVPDSPHNKDELEHLHHDLKLDSEHENDYRSEQEDEAYGEKYAEEYQYMSYMEKKVHNIVHNGSIYLEGLRRALEDYGELLKNCSRLNFTEPQSSGPWFPENERPGPQSQSSGGSSQQPGFGFFNNTASNQTFPGLFLNPSEPLSRASCARATRASEHVRRLAELSLWATRELQDRAYSKKYEKQNPDEEEQEAELLLRLAFFLDRLAYFTGYEPDPKNYLSATTTKAPTTAASLPSAMGPVGDDVKTQMMDCIRSSSSDPDKCRYPLAHPEFLKQLFNITDPPGVTPPATTESNTPQDSPYREIFRDPIRLMNLRRQKRDSTVDNQKEDLKSSSQAQDWIDDRLKRLIETEKAKLQLLIEDARLKRGIDIQEQDLKDLEDEETRYERKVEAEEDTDEEEDPRNRRGLLETALITERLAHRLAEAHKHEEDKHILEEAHEHEKDKLFDKFLLLLKKKPLFKKLEAIKNVKRKIIEKIVQWSHKKHEPHELHEHHEHHDHHEHHEIIDRKFHEKFKPLELFDKKFFEIFEHHEPIDKKFDEIFEHRELIDELFDESFEEFVERDPIRHKRSLVVDDPALNVMKYYVKHKVWENSNPLSQSDISGEFDVNNQLSTAKLTDDVDPSVKREKRSIDNKKYEHLRLPEDPFQDLSDVAKHRKGVNYVVDENLNEKMRLYWNKIRHSDSLTAKDYVRKLLKTKQGVHKRVQKRSVDYQRKVKPSRSQDPRQDISYYVKNKYGTEYQDNLAQAAQVRAGLEAIFQRPNIEIVRRYGSAGPASFPVPLGVAQSFFSDL